MMEADQERRPRYGGVVIAIGGGIALTLVGKLSALAKDIVLAANFGAGVSTDAYFIANIVPGLAWAAFYATIVAVFLPLYVAERESDPDKGRRIAAEAVKIYVLAGVLVMIATAVLAGPIVELTAPEAAPEVKALAGKLIVIMALSFGVTGYVGVQNALQQANGAYLWPLSVPAINNVLAIVAICVAAWFGNIAIAVAGASLAWLIQAPLQRAQTRRFYSGSFGIRVRRKTFERIALLSWPVMIGIFLDQANIYIGIVIASQMSEGAVSHLSYASRLALFLGNLVSWLVAYFLFPRIAACATRGQDQAAGRSLGLGIMLIAGLTIPLLAVSVVFGADLIRLVYGRGKFDAASVSATAVVFVPYAFGTVFMGLREMLNRAFFSYQRPLVPMIVGALAALVNVAASLALSKRFGLPGIAMGASISATIFVALQFSVIFVWKPALLDKRSFLQAGMLLVCGVLAALLGSLLLPAIEGAYFLIRLVLGAVAVGGTYVGLAILFDRVFNLGLSFALLNFTGSRKRDPA